METDVSQAFSSLFAALRPNILHVQAHVQIYQNHSSFGTCDFLSQLPRDFCKNCLQICEQPQKV